MYQLTHDAALDGWERWGFVVPSADSDPAWLEIACPFQRYDLEPDPDCELSEDQLSAFRGVNGVRAFFAKRDGQRGLVIQHFGGRQEWAGRRAIAEQ